MKTQKKFHLANIQRLYPENLVRLDFSTVDNLNTLLGFARLRAHSLDLFHHVHPFNHPTKYCVLAVQPGASHGGDEELRSVRIRACVSHGQQTRFVVTSFKILVVEFIAVNRLSPDPCSVREVASLQHELRNDPMETRVLVMQSLSAFSHSFFPGAEGSEILSSFRNHVVEQLERYFLRRRFPYRHIEKNLGSLYLRHIQLKRRIAR